MRKSLPALFVVLTALTAVPAVADPSGDVAAMVQSFAAVKSLHAQITLTDGKSIGMDMVFPDKVHETMSNGMQMIIIGPDAWMNPTGKRWAKLPITMGSMRDWMSFARQAGLTEKPAKDYAVTDLGTATIDGVATRHYRVVEENKKPVEMWIGPDHLPVQIHSDDPKNPATIVYSQYNAIPDITPPI